jgi:dihydropteroate synthase
VGFATPIKCRHAAFDGVRTYVVGVVNVTPDSFSDGGRFVEREAAVAHGVRLAGDGADLLDVGGESTRPGAAEVAAEEEIARVVPVIEALARAVAVPISIDTRKASVAAAALAAGAEVVNDVSGGADEELFAVCARAGAPLVIGHLRGTPATMQRGIAFSDPFEEVAAELAGAIARARAAGVAQVIADPGIGFGKTTAHNLALLSRAGELSRRLGAPVMVGPSRKKFLGEITGLDVNERLAPTLGACVAAAMRGADFVRVHDVLEARRALAVADAVRGAA